MPKLLEKLKLSELSLVDKGANQHARVSIFKRDASEKPEDAKAEVLGKSGNKEKVSMSTVEKKVEGLTADLEKANTALAEATAKLEKADAFSKLSDAEKSFIEKMDDKGKGDYMGMSAADRKKKMDSVKKSDETLEVHGQTISKSAVGDAEFAIFKALTEEAAIAKADIAKARETAELVTFTKQASDEFGALPGTEAEIAAVLKGLSTLDDDVKKTTLAIFKSAATSAAAALEKVGHSNGSVGTDLENRVQKMATEIAKRDSISKTSAVAKVWVENPDLYAEYETANA